MVMLVGCANTQLRVSTVRQAKTLTDLQYAQVLDNLAMFTLDPNVMPWMVTLENGSTQIADTGGASAEFGFADGSPLTTVLGLTANRSIVDQWGTVPITNDATLGLLRRAYRIALGFDDFLDVAAANDLGHDLSQQIATNSDISIDANTKEVAAKVFLESDEPRRDTDSPGMKPVEDIFVPALPSPSTEDLKDKNQTTPAKQLPKTTSTIQSRSIDLEKEVTSTLVKDFLVETKEKHPDGVARFEVPDNKPSTGLARETARQVNSVQDALVLASREPWFHVGKKCEVPKDACYVGHYCSRCGEAYVWVCADGRADLAEFTLVIMKLAAVYSDSQVLTIPSGVQFSPALNGGR